MRSLCTPNLKKKTILFNVLDRFECPDERGYSLDKCYFKGRAHYPGEQMASDILPGCVTSCTCTQFVNSAHFMCSHISCPNLFQNHVDLSCVLQYDGLKECCSSRQICGKSFGLKNPISDH